MGGEKRTLTLGVTGEFITQIAREWFYSGEKSFSVVMEILENSMAGTDIPKAQIRRYAEDVLLGRAALKGCTSDDTYRLVTYEAGEEEKLPEKMNIWEMPELRKEEVREKEHMTEKYIVAMEHLPDAEKRAVKLELGEELEISEYQALDNFIKRMTDTEEHTTEDYGWLEPNGTFHGVEWGEHSKWADNWLRENLTEEEYEETDCKYRLYDAGDALVDRGWILLHNPSQGIAYPTESIKHTRTKAQKEFLYDYYMERGCEKEANEIWQED